MPLDCSKCPEHCCGKGPINGPILMPYEVKLFRRQDRHEVLPGYWRLKRNENRCIFLTDKNRCAIYACRPLECQLYPWIFTFQGRVLDLKLHYGCPQRAKAKAPEFPVFPEPIPDEWWEKFESILE